MRAPHQPPSLPVNSKRFRKCGVFSIVVSIERLITKPKRLICVSCGRHSKVWAAGIQYTNLTYAFSTKPVRIT